MEAKKITLEDAILLARQMEDQIATLKLQVESLQNEGLKISLAKTTISELKKVDAKAYLIPIVGNVLLKVKDVNKEKVIVGIGASIYVEKNPDEAIEILNKKINRIEKIIGDFSYRIEVLRMQAIDLEEKIRKAIQKG